VEYDTQIPCPNNDLTTSIGTLIESHSSDDSGKAICILFSL